MAAPPQTVDELKNSDRRYLPRWEINTRVIYHPDHHSQTHIGCLKDLSASGACMHVEQALPMGQKLKLLIRLSEVRIVNLEGIVVWSRPINNQPFVGIHFHNVTDYAHQMILDHAFEIKHEDVVKHWFDGWEGKKPPSE